MEIRITKLEKANKVQWDHFVENESVNGTFLQEWRFLDYHPNGRFEDCSVMFWDNDKLVAVCPACIVSEDGKKMFYSHVGSTYGGLVITESLLRTEKMQQLIASFDAYLQEENFQKCILKPTMDLLCTRPQSLLEFLLPFNGYQEHKELNLYIDYGNYDKNNVLTNFSRMKKRNTQKCIKEGLKLQKLQSYEEMKKFHAILAKNLTKYNKSPIHTPEELIELQRRLGENIEFYGAYQNDLLLSGTMVFLFDKTLCAHTQYLAADIDYNRLNPMTFIYFKMAEMFAQRDYKFLSWGIASGHLGYDINYSLANNKEEFGSMHSVNRIYEKTFS